jgi:hypothetical protein
MLVQTAGRSIDPVEDSDFLVVTEHMDMPTIVV